MAPAATMIDASTMTVKKRAVLLLRFSGLSVPITVLFWMAYIAMAPHTRNFLSVDFGMRGDVFDDLRMAVEAGLFGDAKVPCLDADRVRKLSSSEGEGVPKAIVGLHPIFSEDVVRSVTVITYGHRAMARFDPGIVMILHDVAVGTCFRITGQVRTSLGVDKSKRTNPAGHTQRSSDDDSLCRARIHQTPRDYSRVECRLESPESCFI